MMDEQTFEQLRDALNNLYDAEHLRASPLARTMGLAGRPDTPIALQKVLEGLIQELKPRRDEPGHSQKRRMYDLLYSRYVDQFSQREVANQLGISLRSYQREQKLALEFLVGVLAEKYPGSPAQAAANGNHAGQSPSAELDDEFAWMFSPSAPRSAEMQEALASACQLSQPLISHYNVDVCTELAPALHSAAIHPQALLQIALNVLVPAIHLAAGGRVTLQAAPFPGRVELICRIHGQSAGGTPLPGLSAADQANLGIARRLAEKAGGSFRVNTTGGNFAVMVHLPTLESLPVLVIDDSADNIKLMQRYLAGTRYQMNSLTQPELALDFIEQARPQVVILDLMMPGVDGLEILTRLHSNPLTVYLPVVVCTILPQEELALSLGASAFLRKPVKRENLLATLDRLCAAPLPDSD
jgi:CheY-like chemotaxis protein